MPARSAVEVRTLDTDITVVKLVGEHDLSGTGELAEKLQQPLLAGQLLIVDLSEADFIDCSVLQSLVAADRLARLRGLRVTLQLHRGSDVARLLAVTGLTRQPLCADSRQEAATFTRAGRYVSSSSGSGATGG